jgi:pyridoxamine 5'-phosphate oxidase
VSFGECVKFANEVGTCFLATAEGDQPRVRPLGLCFADSTGFYFQTDAVKSLAKQPKSSPKLELVFWQPQGEGGLEVHRRVSGEVRFV